jgi:hypothetical protein
MLGESAPGSKKVSSPLSFGVGISMLNTIGVELGLDGDYQDIDRMDGPTVWVIARHVKEKLALLRTLRICIPIFSNKRYSFMNVWRPRESRKRMSR